MKKLLTILIVIVIALSGCVLPIQIKHNDEVFSSLSPAVDIIATYYQIKSPEKMGKCVEIAQKILNADSNKLVEQYFNDWKNQLIADIKDPFEKAVAMSLINSFEISVDGDAVLDSGSRDTVRRVMEKFIVMVGSN